MDETRGEGCSRESCGINWGINASLSSPQSPYFTEVDAVVLLMSDSICSELQTLWQQHLVCQVERQAK